MRHRIGDGGARTTLVRHVRLEHSCIAAAGADALGEFLETVAPPCHDRDARALPRRASAVASPIPELAPVTSATVPSNVLAIALRRGRLEKRFRELRRVERRERVLAFA